MKESEIDPGSTFERGRAILDELLTRHGFTFMPEPGMPGAREDEVSGAYVRDDRRIELTFRGRIANVSYRMADVQMSHEAYMTAVLGRNGSNQFPALRGDELDAFRHLRHDLDCYATAFLRGPDEHVRRIAALATSGPRQGYGPMFRY